MPPSLFNPLPKPPQVESSAEFTQHIPPQGADLIRCAGGYANKTRPHGAQFSIFPLISSLISALISLNPPFVLGGQGNVGEERREIKGKIMGKIMRGRRCGPPDHFLRCRRIARVLTGSSSGLNLAATRCHSGGVLFSLVLPTGGSSFRSAMLHRLEAMK